jgi:hypothetical protein
MYTLIVVVILLLAIAAILFKNQENFNIPLRSSSAWDWNLGPGYGAGYGTGYAMWGKWPASLPREPWRNWMWGRRPLIFTTPFTPMPQIDYNDAPDSSNKPISNYNISYIGGKLAVNGFSGPTLQLDRNRNYYFHVYSPGAAFTITDGTRQLIDPISEGTVQVQFTENDPDLLYYTVPNAPASGGKIYLNSTRWM